MRLFSRCTVAPMLVSVLTPLVFHAQSNVGKEGPPNVLVIQREYLKPGKAGMTHAKSESAFVNAMTAAKWPTSYFAMDSMSGQSRSLFMLPYTSFAAWEADNWAMRKNKTLSAAFDKAMLADGELLSSYDSVAAMLRPDLSLNSIGIAKVRYFEISTYIVKPGHTAEFEQIAKMYMDGMRKSVPEAHWDVFQVVYGVVNPNVGGGDVFLVVNLVKSLAETDKMMADMGKFAQGMGPGNMKKLDGLVSDSVAASSTNLFELNPDMSYVGKEFMDADPGFWRAPKPPAAKKPAAKPAE